MSKRWYVINTYSGYEAKVKTNLENRIKSMKMEDKIFQILIPSEEVTETRAGKKRITNKKFFPGYILGGNGYGREFLVGGSQYPQGHQFRGVGQ